MPITKYAVFIDVAILALRCAEERNGTDLVKFVTACFTPSG
jgi:hypothetical protein